MTDIRAKLSDACEGYFRKLEADAYRPEGCSGDGLADVLLAVDGIAIVDLPEQVGTTTSGVCFGADVMTYHDRVLIGCDLDISFGYARELAAALFAAANAAEAASNG